MANVWFAFGLTVIAGLSTGIGSIIAFFSKRTNSAFLAISLGFSAGVMIYISLAELMMHAKEVLVVEMGIKRGQWMAILAFFAGIAVIWVIDVLIPSYENPHEPKSIEDMNQTVPNCSMHRIGVLTAITIAIHNFPEGLATFTSSMQKPSFGIGIAIAIALHNIPEGIAVSVPIWVATCSKRKAFVWSFLSGFSEPIGAIIGYFFLRQFFSGPLEGFLLAFVAGIMVFISLDELLPTAEKFGKHHQAISGVVAGMGLIAISLMLLNKL